MKNIYLWPANWFEKDKEGRTIFYPQGFFGAGFDITAKEQKIKRFVLQTAVVAFLCIGGTFVLFEAPLYYLTTIIVVTYYELRIKRMLKDVPAISEKPTFREGIECSAKSFSMGMLILFETASILGLISCIFGFVYYGLLLNGTFFELAESAVLAIIAGICVVIIGRMIYIKKTSG